MARPTLPSYNDPGASPTNPEGGWVGIIKAAINNVSDRIDDAVNSITGKANDGTVVHLAGTETISGAKSFTSPVSVPTATSDSHAVNRAYYVANLPSGTGGTPADGSITAAKIAPAYDTTLAHKTGAETLAGVKTFTSPPVVPTPVNDTDAANRAYVLSSIGQITTNPTYTASAQGGSIDNRASINSVIDQVNANGGGSIRLGPGLHRLTGPLNPLLANVQLDNSPGARITLASGYSGGLRIKITDGATTSGSTTLTSTAQAQFVSGDVGKRVTGVGIPDGTTITARASATSVTMSNAATATNTGVTVTVGAAIFTLIGKYAAIRTLQIIGGGNVGTEQAPNSAALNPFVGAAIDLGFGASFANVQDLDVINLNGWCLLAETVSVGGLYGGVFDGIRGNYNAKGIRIAGNAANKDGQVFLDNLDLQVVTQGHVLDFDTINDLQVGKVNGCTGGDVATAHGLNIVGSGSSIFVDNYDVGTFPTIPGAGSGIYIGGGTPNNIRVNGGVAQSGSPAVLIDGGFNIHLGNLQVSRGGGAGVRITGGDLISLVDMTFARNGYTAGAGQCELEVTTTTGRVRVDRCDFTTPYGTASQQVDGVFKLPAVNRVTVTSNNRYTGGHTLDQRYVGGNLPGVLEGSHVDAQPSDHKFAAWSLDPATAAGNTLLPVAGTMYGARVLVSDAQIVNNLYAIFASPGAGLTGGNYAALYDDAGNLIAQTVDQASGWMTAGSGLAKPMALSASALLSTPGWYRIGAWFNGTTSPAFIRGGAHQGVNANLSAGQARFWSANTGLTTTAPATLGTLSSSNVAWCLGVY